MERIVSQLRRQKTRTTKSKRVRKKRCPLITGGLRGKTRRRDFLKKKATSSSDSTAWDQYKRSRNQANNAIKLAKKLYVSDNLKINKGNLVKTLKEFLKKQSTKRLVSFTVIGFR